MSVTFSIRISKQLKELMDRLNVNWDEEIRKFLEIRVYELLKEQILTEAKGIRESIRLSYGIFPSPATVIGEDRKTEH